MVGGAGVIPGMAAGHEIPGAMVVEHVIPESVHQGGVGLAPGMIAGQEPESSGSESESMTVGSGSESGGTTELGQ